MKIAILGLGVVGNGVYEQIVNHHKKIVLETECDFELSYGLVKEITNEISQQFKELTLTENVDDILNDKTVDCIVEVMGGIAFPYEVIKTALLNKKHVVTANKDLMAVHGYELLKLAKANNCDLYYEASVAGGIPVLRTIMKGLASDYIYDVKGILNGTSNFILTKMTQDKLSYEDALKQAQDLGFAESDPTADVEGIDAARKVAILSSLSYHIDAVLDDVVVSGIANVSAEDIELANLLSYQIKLIGHTKLSKTGVSLSVAPTFINNNHQLAQVNNEMNAVYINGEAIGELMLYGPGAGSKPTGTAVMSDVLEVARNMKSDCNGRDIILPANNKNVINGEDTQDFIVIGSADSINNLAKELVVTAYNNYLIVTSTYQELMKKIKDYPFKVYPIID